jgi:hypothetical protein
VEAAEAQHTALPGEQLAAAMVVRLAKGVMAAGLLNAMYLYRPVKPEELPGLEGAIRAQTRRGQGTQQALLALARRRVNVLWAMIRDGACYEATPPVSAAA